MRFQVPISMPFTVDTTMAPGGTQRAARLITSRNPWLGIAQITSSRPSRASSSREVARTRSGMRTSLR